MTPWSDASDHGASRDIQVYLAEVQDIAIFLSHLSPCQEDAFPPGSTRGFPLLEVLMKNQTARRPDNQRPTRSVQAKKYTRQSAHVEARRDGTPLIFGWGGHLSRNDKVRIQRRAVWSVITLLSLLIVAVIVGFWINNNVVVPNQPITSIAGQAIPQSDYHKLVALKGQLELNKIEGAHGLKAQSDDMRKKGTEQQKIGQDAQKKIDDLNKQITALPAGPSDQRTNLEGQVKAEQAKYDAAKKIVDVLGPQYQTLGKTTIPNEQILYTQSQIGNDSATWLQDDVLVRNWLATQNSSIQNKINPSAAQIDRAMKQFRSDFPKSGSYDAFLSTSGVNDGDVHTMMTLKLRRDNMQNYLASQITSPAKQVKASSITLSTEKDAKDILTQIKGGKDMASLAKEKSLDNDTKAKGGDLDWLVQGQYVKKYGNGLSGGNIDQWLFDPARKAGDLSPVISDNGTFRVLQIAEIDPSRAIDDATLKTIQGDISTPALKNNSNDTALMAWLVDRKVLAGMKPGAVDPDKLLDPMNMPAWIPSSPPVQPTTGATSPTGGATDPTGGAAAGGATDPTGGAAAGGTTSGQPQP